jgi:hypothetical protein
MARLRGAATRALRRALPNVIVDRLVRSLGTEELRAAISECAFSELDLSAAEMKEWTLRYCPRTLEVYRDPQHKKIIEFYSTFQILRPEHGHVVMDAAGGAHGYLSRLDCRRRTLQDIRISEATRQQLGDAVEYLEGDAASIPLPDGSVDRISCHHSFEHFQGDSDMTFIREVQRLLAPGGRCVILPIFLVDRYSEVTDRLSLTLKFDPASQRVIDPTAAIPGGRPSGHYARAYDLAAFRRRVLDNIDRSRFAVTIVAVTMDGAPVPDMARPCHRQATAFNFPYRALVIDRT